MERITYNQYRCHLLHGAGIALLVFLLAAWPLRSRAQFVTILVDAVNTTEMYRGNSIHEAGFNMLKDDQAKILKLQTQISFYSKMMVRRETEKMQQLLSIDDFFSGNKEWQDHFKDRMDTARANLDVIEELLEQFPRATKLSTVHERLTEDLDDAEKKFEQAINKSGQENLMRNDERNHLAILADEQLEKVAALIRDLFNAIPQGRTAIMNEGLPGTGSLPDGVPSGVPGF